MAACLRVSYRWKSRKLMCKLVIVLLGTLLSIGFAQRLSWWTSGSTMTFNIDGATFQQALSCPTCNVIAPETHNSEIRIQRQSERQNTLQGSRSPWLPNAPLELEARYRVRGNQSGQFLTTDFIPLETLPENLFDSGDPQTYAVIEYRLRLGEGIRAGTYETTVTYRVASDTLTQQIRVIIAPLLDLRISGVPAGQLPSLTFDYSAQPLPYLQAITARARLPHTAATFSGIDVLSNDPRGFTLELSLTPLSSAPLDPSLLYLLDAPAHRTTIRENSVTTGYQTVIRASDFSLHPVGAEAPGSYLFLLTYTLLANP